MLHAYAFFSFIEGLAELVVQSNEDIARLYEQGNRVRKMASADKSPSHSRYFRSCVHSCMMEDGGYGLTRSNYFTAK